MNENDEANVRPFARSGGLAGLIVSDTPNYSYWPSAAVA